MVSAPSGPASFQTGFPVRPDRLVEARTPTTYGRPWRTPPGTGSV